MKALRFTLTLVYSSILMTVTAQYNRYYVVGSEKLDTLDTRILSHQHSGDSIHKICYELLSHHGDVFKEECFILIHDGSYQNVKFISERELFIQNQVFKVTKYLKDDPNIADDEEILFYTPSLGIIFRYNLAWEGYTRLFQSSSLSKTQFGILIVDQIMMDEEFLNSLD